MVMPKPTTCFKFGIKQCLLAAVINHVSKAVVSSCYIRGFYAGKYMMAGETFVWTEIAECA